MNEIKIHVGCGKRDFGKDWIHIDALINLPHIHSDDIWLNDFKNESIDLIYACHFLEHFPRNEGQFLLKKWNRKLKWNGILRLAVPNFTAMADLYLNEGYAIERFIGPLFGRVKVGDEIHFHKMVFDRMSLVRLLLDCGYSDVRDWDWRETPPHDKIDDYCRAYLPHMDFQRGTLISLNLEALK